MSDPLGTIAGRYELLAELGRGGMGVVYRARDLRLARIVALKLIDRAVAGDADLRARFLREAHALARVRDPGVVAIHDVGEDDGRPWLVMDLCEGGSLFDRLRTSPMSVQEARTLLEEVGKALAAIHGAGIVHRDLKPANILVDRERWLVSDFGISSASGESTITRSGMVLGTPDYWAPETMSEDTRSGPPADVYSLGCVLFHVLTGAPPYKGENPLAVGMRHAQAPVPELPEPVREADPELAALVERMLAKDPGNRPTLSKIITSTKLSQPTDPALTLPAATLQEPAGASSAQTEPAQPSGRRRRVIALAAIASAVVAIGAGVGGALVLTQGGEDPPPPPPPPPPPVAIAVPRIVGATMPAARAGLRAAAQEARAEAPALRTEGRRYSDAQPKGRIISQTPKPGGFVKSGGTMGVVLSKGAATIRVPDTSGAVDDVGARLERVGLTPRTSLESSFDVPSGVVLRADPTGGQTTTRPEAVDLVVSSGWRSDAIEITRDERIANWPTGSAADAGPGSGRLSTAETVFGPAAGKSQGDFYCEVQWPAELGMKGFFYNLGGSEACGPLGQMDTIVMSGPRFVTDRGLAIGSSLSRLETLYPEAKEGDSSPEGLNYVLLEQYYPWADGLPSPSLVATVSDGAVSRLIVTYPSGGD